VPKNSSQKKDNNQINSETKGVKTLLGDPKKAIRILAGPMIIAMFIQTIYNLVDTWWVSFLGTDALAAVGFVFPFFIILMAFATGLGTGGGSAISRKIGARDKKGADNVAVHTIIIMLLITVVFTIILLVFTRNIFIWIGTGDTVDMAVGYAQIIFAGSIFIFFTNVANAILRSEGDAKRSMYAMMLGAILNIFLDPIFIYDKLTIGNITIPGLGLGVPGAAWATVLSLGISAAVMFNWLFLRKDTYVIFKFHGFKFNKIIIKDIFRVGVPSALLQLSMAITMIIVNIIIVMVVNAGTDGVAVYQTGWKVATVATMPLIGISTAVISVTGAAYGAKEYKKLKTAYMYSVKLGLIIEIIIAAATFILAPFIAASFTSSEDAARIFGTLQNFLMIICLFYPSVAFGMLTSSMFQGTGKGINSLLITLLRTIIFTPFFVLLFATIWGMGLPGVWWGIVVANLTGSTIAFLWGKLYLDKLLKIKKDGMIILE
jgi:putative MATE family efflux protein